MVVHYKIDLDMAVTADSLKQLLQKYVKDHAGYSHNLKIDPNSIGFEGKKIHTYKECTTNMDMRVIMIN